MGTELAKSVCTIAALGRAEFQGYQGRPDVVKSEMSPGTKDGGASCVYASGREEGPRSVTRRKGFTVESGIEEPGKTPELPVRRKTSSRVPGKMLFLETQGVMSSTCSIQLWHDTGSKPIKYKALAPSPILRPPTKISCTAKSFFFCLNCHCDRAPNWSKSPFGA